MLLVIRARAFGEGFRGFKCSKRTDGCEAPTGHVRRDGWCGAHGGRSVTKDFIRAMLFAI